MRALPHSFRMPSLSVAAVALVAAAGVGASSAASRPATTGAPGTFAIVKVTVSDTMLKLNRKSSRGVSVVSFKIKNIGKKPHVFLIGTSKSQVLKRGQTQDMPVNFADFGKYKYRVTLNGTKTMRGLFSVSR